MPWPAYLARYKPAPATRRGARPSNPREHHSTPPAIREALQRAFGLETDRYATPLTCSASCVQYWTPHREDAVFAAQHDAYSSYLERSNLCNPGDDDKDMHKALKWAIKSAQAEYAPVVAVLLLAAKPGAGYLRLIREHPGQAALLCTIPRQQYPCPTPHQLVGDGEGIALPKWNVNVVVVANPQGWHTHVDRAAMQNLYEASVTARDPIVAPRWNHEALTWAPQHTELE